MSHMLPGDSRDASESFFTEVFPCTDDKATHDLDRRLASARRRVNLFGLTRNYYATPSFISSLAKKAAQIPVRVYAMDPRSESRKDHFRLEPPTARWDDPDRYEQKVLVPLAGVPHLEVYTYNFPCSFAIEEFDDSCRVMLYGYGKRGTEGPILILDADSPLYPYFESQVRWLEMLANGGDDYWNAKGLRVERYSPRDLIGSDHELSSLQKGLHLIITALGTGSAQPSRNRKNASYLVEASNGDLLLVDCSGSPLHEVLSLGREPHRLRHVVLTHSHVDHIYALPSLVHGLWVTGRHLQRQLPVTVSGTEETLHVARRLLDAFGLRTKPQAVPIDYCVLSHDTPTIVAADFSNRQVSAFPVNHAGLLAVGVCLSGSPSVAFTGDCLLDETLAAALDCADLVIGDCGGGMTGNSDHAGVSDWIRYVRAAGGGKSVYLTHLPDSVLPNFEDLSLSLLSDGQQIVLPG